MIGFQPVMFQRMFLPNSFIIKQKAFFVRFWGCFFAFPGLFFRFVFLFRFRLGFCVCLGFGFGFGFGLGFGLLMLCLIVRHTPAFGQESGCVAPSKQSSCVLCRTVKQAGIKVCRTVKQSSCVLGRTVKQAKIRAFRAGC